MVLLVDIMAVLLTDGGGRQKAEFRRQKSEDRIQKTGYIRRKYNHRSLMGRG
jgi:hypothetical protein